MIMMGLSYSAEAGGWRTPVGLSYPAKFKDVVDIYENNLQAEGYLVYSKSYWPIGMTVQPYFEFDNGLGIGGGIGPIAFIYGDRDFLDFPVNLALRFAFFPKANVSPYVRAGGSYHIASGSYVKGSKPGLVGAFGIEFLRKRHVGFGIEVAYDAAEIEFEKKRSRTISTRENVQPYGLIVSIFAVF
jgi:hypothetical protein